MTCYPPSGRCLSRMPRPAAIPRNQTGAQYGPPQAHCAAYRQEHTRRRDEPGTTLTPADLWR